MRTVDEKFELHVTYLLGVDDLTGAAEVALLGEDGDGEDGHDGGEKVHAVHHGWNSWGRVLRLLASFVEK